MQALGRALLRTLEDGNYSNEGFVTCRQLSASTAFIIITRVHILAVHLPHLATSCWTPTLMWAAAMGDIEICKRRDNSEQELLFVTMQPEPNLLQSQQIVAQKVLGLRTVSRSPWQAYTAVFQVS